MKLKERATELKKNIPAVFLAIKDPKTPLIAKALAFLTVAYALSPIDLVPDFVPVLGYLDDVVILPLLIALTVKLIPTEVWDENKVKAERMWENGRPKRWYYALPVLLLWILLLWLIVKRVFIKRQLPEKTILDK